MLCKHFGTCGGCKTQNISYEEELKQKQLFVENLFPSHPILPIIPCDSPWQYRNKMEFTFSQAKSGEKFLGLMAARGRVVNLEECFLTVPWFIDVLKAVRRWWEKTTLPAYYPPKNLGLLRTLTLRHTAQEKMVILTISGDEIAKSDLETFVEHVLRVGACDSIVLRRQILAKNQPTRFVEEILWGKDHIHEMLLGLKFKIRPASFFQTNTKQAEKLIQKALECARLEGEQIFFDLYCGTATFGILAASGVKEVIGIEINPDAIEDAKENAKSNSINNIQLFSGDVAKMIPLDVRPDCVLVDPPRAGLCPKMLGHLKTLLPPKIIYVSCNPLTQSKNVEELLEAGYKIVTVQPVDQFPRTAHVENIVALDRIF